MAATRGFRGVANSRGYYLRFPCPDCGATQKVLPAQVATEIRCGECPAVIVVPSLEELTAADKAHNHQRKTVGAVRKAPAASRAGPDKPPPPPLELNIVRGHVVSFACPVCHHMMRSTAEELGHVIMCPHCYSPVTVGGEQHKRAVPPREEIPLVLDDTGEDEYQLADEPSPAWGDAAPAKLGQSDQEDDEYRLSEVEHRPPPPRPKPVLEENDLDLDLAPLGDGDDAKSPRRERGVVLQDHDPMDDAWVIQERRDRLRLEDRLAAEAQARRNVDPPDYPFLSGVFNFPFYRGSWPQWLGLTAGTAFVYYLVTNAVTSAQAGGSELFFSLTFSAMAAAAALVLVMFEAVAVLAIVQDTAAGADEVESWPDFNFVDWAGQAFFFINALAFSAAPGFLLASVSDSWGPWRWAAPAVTAALFYPIVLLSQLDGMSPFSVLTPGVIKGPFKSPGAWMAFYSVSLSTLAVAAAVCWMTLRLAAWDGPVVAIVLAVVITTALLVENRLIGRLAWFCEETEPVVEPVESEESLTEEKDREAVE